MPTVTQSKKSSKVAQFPNAAERSRRIAIPSGYDAESIVVVTLGSNSFLHLGLHYKDLVIYDKSLKPENGELCVLVDDQDSSGKSIAIYSEPIHHERNILGTIVGFQRWYKEAA